MLNKMKQYDDTCMHNLLFELVVRTSTKVQQIDKVRIYLLLLLLLLLLLCHHRHHTIINRIIILIIIIKLLIDWTGEFLVLYVRLLRTRQENSISHYM